MFECWLVRFLKKVIKRVGFFKCFDVCLFNEIRNMVIN